MKHWDDSSWIGDESMTVLTGRREKISKHGRAGLCCFPWKVICAVVFVIFVLSSCETIPAPPPLQESGELTKVVIGYYYSGTRAEFDHTEIQYRYLSHIAHAFAWPDASGNLFIPEQIFDNDYQVSVSPLAWSHAMFVIANHKLGYLQE